MLDSTTMTNAELQDFIKDRIESVHARMDEIASDVSAAQVTIAKHEKECAQQGGIVTTKLSHLDRMSWAILSVLAAEGVAGICFAFYMLGTTE